MRQTDTYKTRRHQSKTARRVWLSTMAGLIMLSGLLMSITFGGKPAYAAVEFTVNTGTVLGEYVGHGTQYNNNLYASISAVDGITPSNVGILEEKVIELGSQHVRIFFDPDSWNTVNYPDYMSSFIDTVELAQNTGASINITYWHGPYTNIPQQMGDFADVLYDLIVTRGLTGVKYVTIQNEVNTTSISQTTYESLYRELDSATTTLGIRDDVKFIGGDLTFNSQQSWFDYMAANMNDVLDGYSVHIYWDYDNRSYATTRLDDVRSIVDGLAVGARKPVYITEYGVRGERPTGVPAPGYLNGTTTPIGDTIINAYQTAWFHIQAMKKKFVATVKWDAYKAKYDNGTQYYGEIGSANDGYPLKPVYNVTRLLSRTSEAGWNLVNVTGSVAGKTVTALKDPNSADMAVYALNDTGASTTISIGGLTANKKYYLSLWNDDGSGGTQNVGQIVTNGSGETTVRLQTDSFAVLSTINPGDLERVAHYKFDESSGTSASDSAPYGYPATLVNGPTWSPSGGKIGGALDLDGSNDYVTTPHVLDPANTGGFSAAAWVKLDTASGGAQIILQQSGTQGRIWLCRLSNGKLETYIGNSPLISNGTIAVGQWHHVAVTYDGTTARLFLDGQLDTSAARTMESSTSGMVIGANKSFGELWNGLIDDVQIFNRKVNANDIEDLWNSGYWRFDETSGTTAADAAGYNQSGTVFGAAWTASGKLNGALDFDGVNDYATLPNILDPAATPFTAAAWVKLDASSGTVQIVLQQAGTSGKIWLYRRPEGTVGTFIGGTALVSTSTLAVGTWGHLAVTYDGTTAKLYLNGVQENSAARTMSSSSDGMLVGVSKTSDQYWNGPIDNLRIFNRNIGPTGVEDLYKQGR